MYKLYVWVPTQGWKLMKRFRPKGGFEEAITVAAEFEPLEVKLEGPGDGRKWLGGACCKPVRLGPWKSLKRYLSN